MGSAVLLPSTYTSDGSQFYVRDPQYMYTDVSSTTHSEISSYSYDTNPHYLYLRGFSFANVIPSGMSATSVTVRVKLEFVQGLDDSSDYYPMLCNGSSVISGTPIKSGNIYTFSGLDWDDISGYGSSFGVRLCLKKSYAYASTTLSVYGAEIDVEYAESGGSNAIYIKQGGVWKEADAVYKKIGGVWTEQTDLANVFDSEVNYILRE